jgi:predicted unusual protein kinase regulating ubiquinone biosynthesis (AarF/ABC1/UbiB family)
MVIFTKFTNILNEIKKQMKVFNIFSSSLYSAIKYKLNFVTFEDAVISTCNSLTHKNYIFTKVIQWGVQEIYNDANIKNNDKLKNYFSMFSSNVPYTPHELEHSFSIIKRVMQYADSRNETLVIENGDEFIPMNSGTVSLVFKARLNNVPVIIKILRPNIKNKIKEDIDILLCFFKNPFIRKINGYYIKLDFQKFIENNADILLRQCDFDKEVANALIFKNNLKNKKNIVIPFIFQHFTETFNDVIIMEYLEGPIAKNVPLEDLKKEVEPLQSFFFESLFRYKILHGDFHLGNIIIMDGGGDGGGDGDNNKNNNKIGIIDFGIVYYLTDEDSNKLFDIMFLSLSQNANVNAFYNILKTSIQFICSDKNQHKTIFEKLIQDKDLEYLIRSENYSANTLIKIINKIMSLENVELKSSVCQIMLSTMSGLQTIEYVNNNMNLTDLTKSFINKSIRID